MSAPAGIELGPEVGDFLESGVHLNAATRDAGLRPELVNVQGLRIHASRRDVTAFIADALFATTRANLEHNGLIAISATRPRDHRSLQLKGRMTALRPATADERHLIEQYRAQLVVELDVVGVFPRLTRSVAYWPATAVELAVLELFDQTPGPGAGDPVPPGAAGRAR